MLIIYSDLLENLLITKRNRFSWRFYFTWM